MRRRIIVLVSAVAMVLPALVACARGSSQPPGPTGIERLRRDATGELHVMWDQESGKPAFIRGRIRLWPVDLRGKADPAAVALAFVGYYGEAFGLKDAKAEVELEEVVAEEPWTTQVTLRQMYQGVEVYNARMRVYIGGDGQEVVMVSNGFVPGIALANAKPRLSAHQALTQPGWPCRRGSWRAPRNSSYTLGQAGSGRGPRRRWPGWWNCGMRRLGYAMYTWWMASRGSCSTFWRARTGNTATKETYLAKTAASTQTG